MENEKITGQLTFDINSGKFWITDEEQAPLVSLDFGDTFEVKVDDNWIETGLEIINDNEGNLLFKLKNTNYSGFLDGIEARK